MKWNTNGITFRRGCYECLIAQFDGSGPWWSLGAIATQQTMKSEFRRLGNHLGAASCEVKALYDDSDNETEQNVLCFRFDSYDNLFVAEEETQKYVPYKLISSEESV